MTAELLTKDKVFRRRVFYIPGFDPFHPRRYRELYRREGTEQARLMGYELALRPKTEKGGYGWRVTAQIEGGNCQTDFEVLVWSDIVRASMSASVPATYWQLAKTAWVYFSSGALWQMAKLRKGPIIAALYPAVFLVVQLIIALAMGWAFGALLAHFSHWALGWGAGMALGYGVLLWFKSKDNKVFAWYLIHDYAYCAALKGAYSPQLGDRLQSWGEKIKTALDAGYDEVLVVGHSSGAHLGVSVLANLLRQGGGDDRLSFLSLGQAVPMVSFLPKAQQLRADLAYLAQSDLFWLDVTAPGDGCSFALCDPVAVTGVAPPDQKAPLILSAAFSQTLSPAKMKSLKRHWFRLHFQYLCAFDQLAGRGDDYDYFRITAGPLDLRSRMGGRKPSASLIRKPTNRYRSLS